MESLPRWLLIEGLPGDLSGLRNRLGLVAALAQHWQAIAGGLWQLGVAAPVDSPARLAAYLAEHLGDEPVAQLFETLGLSDLHARLADAGADILAPGQPWAKLVRPCSDFAERYRGSTALDSGRELEDGDNPGLVTLAIPPQAATGAASAGPADLRLSLAGDGALEAEAGALWPFRKDGVLPGLLRVGVAGEAEASAGASLPFGAVGQGGVSTGVAAAVSLGLYYRPAEPERAFADALGSALIAIPSPLDLVGISHAMALADLEGLVLACDGSVQAGISLLLGKDFDVTGFLEGKAGVDASLGFRRNARWVLSLRRDGQLLRFVLSREIEREREWSAGVGITLDHTALARRVQDRIAELDGLAGPLLARVRPFLSPGSYLAREAKTRLQAAADALVADPALRAALAADLSIVMSPENTGDNSALAGWLRDRIADRAAGVAGGILADAEAWASAIVEDLLRDAPGLPQTDVQQTLSGAVGMLLKEAKAQFEAVLGELASTDALSRALAKELKEVGIKLAEGRSRADAALAGVRELVQRVDAFTHALAERTAEGVEQKLQARFGWTGKDSAGTHYELAGSFADSSAPAAALWRALVTGHLEPFQRILADPASAPHGVELSPHSSLARFAGSSRDFSLEVSVLGLKVGIRSIVKGEASISIGAAGDVAVTAKASSVRDVEGFDEGRSAGFVSTWDLLLSKLDEGRVRRRMTLALALDHDDDDLSADEVSGFLDGLVGQRLVESTRAARAREVYQTWRLESAEGRKVRGRIEVRMALAPTAVERMITIGRALNDPASALHLPVFRLAAQAQLDAGVSSQERLERDAKEARGEFAQLARVEDIWRVAYLLRDVDLTPPDNGGRRGYRYSALEQLTPRSVAFSGLLATMARIYDAIPVGAAASASGWTEQQYAAAERELAQHARRWMRLNQKFVFWFGASMHPAMLAFLRLLAGMSRPAIPVEEPLAGLGEPLDPTVSSPLFAIRMVGPSSSAPIVV